MPEEDILKVHFGPDNGTPAPYVSDARIALQTIIESASLTEGTIGAALTPETVEGVVDVWPDEGRWDSHD
ncbi:MAG TPA: hypothetical protein VM124_01585 [Candidatus Limnocylindrales bacterium]|nr:hypothetical protein [Candidatus Limnocylindrales bacterium]